VPNSLIYFFVNACFYEVTSATFVDVRQFSGQTFRFCVLSQIQAMSDNVLSNMQLNMDNQSWPSRLHRLRCT